MSLTSPRADHLEIVRDLVIVIARGEIRSLKELNRYLAERRDWKRARRYHYRAALRDFGLVRFSSLSCELSETAKQLANINNYQDFEPGGLNAEERELFAGVLVAYQHSAYFLSLFMPSGERPETVSRFREQARWISPVRTENGLAFYRGQEMQLVAPQQERAFRWTIKNWLKAVGLVDELEIKPTEFISPKHTHVLFPIKLSLDTVADERFRSWVEGIVQPKGKVVRIPIPLLMHRVCTQHYISVRDFQRGIERLYRQDPIRFRLEKISSVHINRTYERTENYTMYPKVDGTYRGTLTIVSGQEDMPNGR